MGGTLEGGSWDIWGEREREREGERHYEKERGFLGLGLRV